MFKLLKDIKALIKKGYASPEEKAAVMAEIAKLKSEDQEAIADEVGEVEALPETDSEEGDDVQTEVEKGIKALFDRHAKRVEDSVTEKVKTYLEEQRELSAKKAGVYNPEIAEKRKELNSYLRELSAAILCDDKAKVKEMTTSDIASPYAGYTVDSELSAEIRHLMTEYGVARREMTALPLTKGSYKANNLATDVTCYWVDEAGSIRSTEAVLGQESLTLKKLAVIVSLTRELLEDTEIDFISFLGSRVAEGFTRMEDEAFFKGDGTSTYGSFTGLLANASVNEVIMTGTTFASLDAEDLLDMIDNTPSGALANAKFYMHRTLMSVIRKLRSDAVSASDGKGVYLYQAPSDGGPATIWGYPVALVEAMPSLSDSAASTSFILFGDLRRACILGYKGDITVDRFNAGTIKNVANNADINLITTDREAVRWVSRVGYVVILPTAVTKLTTAAASA